ncbi:GNAT family N-acetyltransferase [Paenisporosarcina cavernae]|uniref:N-acetyltransferase n=1 Tax=Paenisporosarcina cavernae TaxID=2320858 RepID=A0A385YPP4_9BACL|nr:N-acetyltransferase [Paenisporosarcina cavernae]
MVPGYPLDVYKQFFPYKIERFKNFPEENEWEGLIILKRTNTIIGDMGFKGGPNDAGEMNLGYSIVPEYEGNGYATEMGKALCNWAINLPMCNRLWQLVILIMPLLKEYLRKWVSKSHTKLVKNITGPMLEFTRLETPLNEIIVYTSPTS